MRLKIFPIDLTLKHVMTVFHRTISRVRTVVVELEQDGLRGYGEACEDPHLGGSLEDMERTLSVCKSLISGYALSYPEALCYFLREQLSANVAAASALEMAACDLWGKLNNVPLWQKWNYPDRNPLPLSSYTLGLDTPHRILEKYEEQPDWPLYRIKLGSRHDMEILRRLRKRTQAPFRLDVNGAWTYQQAIEYLDELKTLNIELIEQPLAPQDVEGMKRLKEVCPIPLIADESCRSFADIAKCVGLFDGVNLKPIKFGGLNRTRRAIKIAKAYRLKTMVGNTIESSVGASATAQFSHIVDYVYLDGPLLIERKLGNGVSLECGKIKMPTGHGIGFSAQREVIR